MVFVLFKHKVAVFLKVPVGLGKNLSLSSLIDSYFITSHFVALFHFKGVFFFFFSIRHRYRWFQLNASDKCVRGSFNAMHRPSTQLNKEDLKIQRYTS